MLGQRELLAFGLSCCERLFKHYTSFVQICKWGDAAALRDVLDTLWECATTGSTLEGEADELFEHCLDLVPHSEDFDGSLLVTLGQEAVMASCRLVEQLSKTDVSPTAGVAGYCFSSLYQHLMSEGLRGDPNSPTDEVSKHQLYTRELERQGRDMDLLAADPDKAVAQLRARLGSETLLG